MKRRLALLLAIIMVLSLGLAGCGGGGGEGDSGSTGGDAETINIGWIGSLTGDQAVWGTCEKQALQMVVDDKNAEGGLLGKQIKLFAYDVKGDTSESVNAVKRLVAQDKVVAVLGPNSSSIAIAIAGVLADAEVPNIQTVATNPLCTVDSNGEVKPYSFRVCFIDPYQGGVVAAYAWEKLQYKNAAILYDVASDYSQGFTQYFEETFEKLGGTIVAKEAFKSGDTDFRPQLTNIKKANPDFIVMPYLYKEVALSANQARELGITCTLMGGDGWPSDNLFEMAGAAVQGSIVVNHVDFNDPALAPFQDKYMDLYGTNLEINGYLVNDAFLVFCAAVEKANSADPKEITKALTEVEVDGLTGHIALSKETHNPEGKEAAIIKLEGDQYVFQERYALKLDD